MRVAEVMIRDPNCCVPSTSARMAASLLKQFEVGILPVVDDHTTHKLVGVVTDRDLCLKALASREDPDEILVEHCMTNDPAYCKPETEVRKVLALMSTRRVHRMPVVDRDFKVVGMISIDDLLRAEAVTAREICAALSAITAPQMKTRARAASAGTR